MCAQVYISVYERVYVCVWGGVFNQINILGKESTIANGMMARGSSAGTKAEWGAL